MNPAMPGLLVVSGLSGSGKSVVLRALEDLDFYCVDNLPAELLPPFVANLAATIQAPRQLAVGIDVRNRPEDLERLPRSLAQVGDMGYQHRLLFLDTADDVLFRRYSETRRRHPLSVDGLPLKDAIALERRRLRPLAAIADRVLDTSGLNVHQLRRWVVTELATDTHPGLSLMVQSFAYRNGVPGDADFVFDVRCLPNPHWDPRLRPLSGRDPEVRDYFASQTEVVEYLAGVASFLDRWLPSFEAGTRSYVTVAFGCTGGRHRSVHCTEWLAGHWRAQGHGSVVAFHRELD